MIAGTIATAALAAENALTPFSPAFADDAPADEVVIFHTNDMHGYLRGNDSSIIGAAYVAGLRNTYPNSLLLDAGDATQGAPLASLTKGSAVIGLMNDAGYDAMCLGNHEFDFGPDILKTNVAAADFPVLGANVLDIDGKPFTEGVGVSGNGCSIVLESGGRRIGVFGLTTTATKWSVMPEHVADITFADEVATAEAQIADLAAQDVDAIVCLAHIGVGPTPCTSIDIAQQLSPEAASKLTAIIDGHSHTVVNEQVNGIAVVQTGCNLANVGKLVLRFSEGKVTATEEQYDYQRAIQTASVPDASVARDIEQIDAAQSKVLGVEVCPNPSTLWAGWLSEGSVSAPTRIVETNFGDMACDALRIAAQQFLTDSGDESTPVVAVENGGGIRAALSRGMLIRGDFVTAFPFSNTVMVKYVTPSLLKGLFENALRCADGQDPQTGMLLQKQVNGEFMQLSGLVVTADLRRKAGDQVVSMVLDGCDEPLDPADDETPIALASNSYVMSGGSYIPLGDVELLAEIGGELETIGSHVTALLDEAGGESMPLMAGTQGRHLYRSGYEPAPWEAHVLIVDADGNPIANTPVTLQIDATDVVDVVTDADGLAAVGVEDGAHSIAIAPASDDPAERVPEAYVNNYMGIGLVSNETQGAWPRLTLA